MRIRIPGITGFVVVTFLTFVAASAARAEVCVTIETNQDTFSASDRSAALLLFTRQLEQAGERVVSGDCARPYTLAHVRLGDTIIVQVSGRDGQREAIAHGMDDLPALYSQMARSIVTGRPMTGFNVVDRTNVTVSQATARRFHTDSIWYARLGHGALFGKATYATPALGFGYRAELDSFAIDVSFLNFQFGNQNSSFDASAQTLLKLSGLYFLTPTANRSPYFGGGLSFGHQNFGGSFNPSNAFYTSDYEGKGLQGELTVGYELARATSFRIFVQADAMFPFYEATAHTYPLRPAREFVPPAIDRRRAPSLVLSLGVGR